MYRRSAILLAFVAVAGTMSPASAQVARRFAIKRTNAAVTIEQPATIASSQDLMFAVSTSTLSLSAALSPTTSTTSTALTSPTRSTDLTTTAARSSGGTSTLVQTASLPASGGAGQVVPVPARASFVLTGESGQSISVTVPESVDLQREGGIETALLNTETSVTEGPQFLGGSFASAGVLSFDVGGQVTLASAEATAGTYNGVLAVVAQYN